MIFGQERLAKPMLKKKRETQRAVASSSDTISHSASIGKIKIDWWIKIWAGLLLTIDIASDIDIVNL